MLTKNEVKYIQSLYHKKYRDEDQVFVAEGPKLAQELLESGYSIKHLYATAEWMAAHPDITISKEVSEMELKRISNLETPNQVVAIAEQIRHKSNLILKGKFTLMLDGIQDPGNMGTIIRIADWFGVGQIICSNDCVDIYNPKVVQSSMGSIVRVTSWNTALEEVKIDKDLPLFGALLQGKNIYETEKVKEGVLIMGNESKGIREPMLSRITHPITIPGAGRAESLNVAVATGIIVGALVNGKPIVG